LRYSVTRLSKKFFSLPRSIVSLIQGKGLRARYWRGSPIRPRLSRSHTSSSAHLGANRRRDPTAPVLIHVGKSIQLDNDGEQRRADPSDRLKNLLMLVPQPLPIPNRFGVHDTIAKATNIIAPLPDGTACSIAPRHMRKRAPKKREVIRVPEPSLIRS